MNKYYVYVLISQKDNKLYIGFTRDLKARLIEHAKGENVSTRGRRPFRLIFYEYFANEDDAKARETFLKSGYGRKQLKKFLGRTLRSVQRPVKRILFATTNPHKIERFQAYYHPLHLQVLNPKDLGINLGVEEEGKTPQENARGKALAYFEATKIPTFAIDYGLYIEKFPKEKQPGLFVRRIHQGRKEATDEEMLDYFTSELAKVGGESKGKWVSAIALVLSPKVVFAENFSRETLLTAVRSPRRTPGEPLNSIQIDPKTKKYFTDLTWEEWLTLQKERERSYIDFMKKHLSEIPDS